MFKTLGFLPTSKIQRYVIFAVTLGNILEWYEIYLYVFWIPTLTSVFFGEGAGTYELFGTIAIFALGFIVRPLGGIVFGYLGDHIGRKKAFVLSILCMTIPAFLISVIPGYARIGIFAPILLLISRIMQIFPAGGEMPGVFCYLYENADEKNKKFMTSFAALGNQIGIVLSAIECVFLRIYLPPEIFINWGWRISFAVGGLLGLGGFYLRYKLHETRLFEEMVVQHAISKRPTHSLLELIRRIKQVTKENKRNILIGIGYGAAQTVSFHLITVLLPTQYGGVAHGGSFDKLLIPVALFILTSAPLAIFGFLGDRIGVKKMVMVACLGMLSLIYPIYHAIHSGSETSAMLLAVIYILFLTIQTALLPFLYSDLFKTSVRYTCVGISFNLSDGVLGGISIVLANYFLQSQSKFPFTISLMLVISCLISLFAFTKIKDSQRS
jgi:MHS family proline/betaine transporter-like MFS transporter